MSKKEIKENNATETKVVKKVKINWMRVISLIMAIIMTLSLGTSIVVSLMG